MCCFLNKKKITLIYANKMNNLLQHLILNLNYRYKHIDVLYKYNIYDAQFKAQQLQNLGHHCYIVFSKHDKPVLLRQTNIYKKQHYLSIGRVATLIIIVIANNVE